MIKPGTNRYEKSGVYISLNVPLFKVFHHKRMPVENNFSD